MAGSVAPVPALGALQVLHHPLAGWRAQVRKAFQHPHGVVVLQPPVQVFLQPIQRGVKGLSERLLEELAQHRAVEAGDEAVGPG